MSRLVFGASIFDMTPASNAAITDRSDVDQPGRLGALYRGIGDTMLATGIRTHPARLRMSGYWHNRALCVNRPEDKKADNMVLFLFAVVGRGGPAEGG